MNLVWKLRDSAGGLYEQAKASYNASDTMQKAGHKTEILTPQRGQKKAMLGLAESNAKLSFEQRFRVLKPSSKAMGEALQDALSLPDPPKRIECFDI